MKLKPFCCLTFLILLNILGSTYSQTKFTYGVKAGVGLCGFMSFETVRGSSNYPRYAYPLGFSAGFFVENELTNNLSIVNELAYQNRRLQTTVYTACEYIITQKITMQFISLPVLLKYKTPLFGNSYFILGATFAYLINANYNYYDEELGEGDVDITKSFPSISTSIEFGLGKQMIISNTALLLELKMQLGVTRFINSNTYPHEVGKWNNLGVEFLVGLWL
jgi:hypothetical protein